MLAGLELPKDDIGVVFQVDTDHFIPGHHDVVHGDVVQVQDAHQHVFVLGRNQGARFIHHGTQFFPAQVILRSLG